MAKKKGAVSESGVKADIIKYILLKKGSVKELDIRRHLEKEYNKNVDQGNVNRHLHDLCEELVCIELISPVKKGLPNHWDITKAEHLKNIMYKFPDIQLNKYENSLMLVLQKSGSSIETLAGLQFYVQLLLSSSFFSACIDTNIKILCERAWGIYRHKNSLETRRIENLINIYYTKYITRYPNIKMPAESFLSMLTQMSRIEEISSKEMFMKIWEEELLGLSKETADGMHQETMVDDLNLYGEMSCVSFQFWSYNLIFELTRFDLLLEHYVYQDMLDGIASEEEIEFAIKTKANDEEERGSIAEVDEYRARFEKRYLSDLEQISKILTKYKHPSIFGNIYNNPTDTYNGLINFFSQSLQPLLSDDQLNKLFQQP